MATQKSQDQPSLEIFNELARTVSTGVEQAHGIGKRRDERTPPTMSQLSEIAHTVVQLLLQPFASVLYQNNRGKLPDNLEQIKIKFGMIDDVPDQNEPEIPEEPEIPPEPAVEPAEETGTPGSENLNLNEPEIAAQHGGKPVEGKPVEDQPVEEKPVATEDRKYPEFELDGDFLEPGLPGGHKKSEIEKSQDTQEGSVNDSIPEPAPLEPVSNEQEPKPAEPVNDEPVENIQNNQPEEFIPDYEDYDEGLEIPDSENFSDDLEKIQAEVDQMDLNENEKLTFEEAEIPDRIENDAEDIFLDDDEGIVVEEEIPQPEVEPEPEEPEKPASNNFDKNALTDEEQGIVIDQSLENQETFQVEERNVEEITVDVLNDIESIAEKDLIEETQEAINDRSEEVKISENENSEINQEVEVDLVADVEDVVKRGQADELLAATEDQVFKNKLTQARVLDLNSKDYFFSGN